MSTRRWRSVHFTTLRPASLSWMHHRQGGRCAYCERSTVMPPKGSDHREPGVLYASRDHRVPIALGGDDHRPNVVMACIPCNGRKGSMEWIDWQEFMRDNPRWWESDETGIRVEDRPRSHGESLQQGPDTSSNPSTATPSHGKGSDAANVANPVSASDRASHAEPVSSDT